MAHSPQYQVRESARSIEIEIGKLLDLTEMLKKDGNDALAATLSNQANKLMDVAIALRIASAH